MTAASPLNEPPRRILIVKPSAIGDVVHALPVLALLRRKWPTAHVGWLVTPTCAGLLERHPLVDELFLFDRRRLGSLWKHPSAAFGLAGLMRQIRQRRFDLVIDLQGLLRSGWFSFRSGAPWRVGFADAREGASIFYNHKVRTGRLETTHAIERNLDVTAALGLGRGPVEFPLNTDDADRHAAAELLAPLGGKPFAVLVPGTNWETKRWPAERFASVVEPLRHRLGLASVVIGGPGDAALTAGIPSDLSLVGKTSLRVMTAVIERAALIISNDTGAMHIAAALDRPLVALFGPTFPGRTGPYGRMDSVLRLDLPCMPCHSTRCSHRSCLRWLEEEPVLRLAESQLHRAGVVPSPAGRGLGRG